MIKYPRETTACPKCGGLEYSDLMINVKCRYCHYETLKINPYDIQKMSLFPYDVDGSLILEVDKFVLSKFSIIGYSVVKTYKNIVILCDPNHHNTINIEYRYDGNIVVKKRWQSHEDELSLHEIKLLADMLDDTRKQELKRLYEVLYYRGGYLSE